MVGVPGIEPAPGFGGGIEKDGEKGRGCGDSFFFVSGPGFRVKASSSAGLPGATAEKSSVRNSRKEQL